MELRRVLLLDVDFEDAAFVKVMRHGVDAVIVMREDATDSLPLAVAQIITEVHDGHSRSVQWIELDDVIGTGGYAVDAPVVGTKHRIAPFVMAVMNVVICATELAIIKVAPTRVTSDVKNLMLMYAVVAVCRPLNQSTGCGGKHWQCHYHLLSPYRHYRVGYIR